MSRPSFRARPIDISQALAIVRDESVLNDESQAVAREVTHAHKNLDKDNEEVRRRRPFPRAPRLPFSHGVRPGTRQRCPGRISTLTPRADLAGSARTRPDFPHFSRASGYFTHRSCSPHRARRDRRRMSAPTRAFPRGFRVGTRELPSEQHARPRVSRPAELRNSPDYAPIRRAVGWPIFDLISAFRLPRIQFKKNRIHPSISTLGFLP